ncbi:MAG: IclR family transcriptional regulator [Ideonella sp.]|jgi:DNA-binding IclR family transcriptional regulator|nr:IclR family transcriptional regulator [Ideonella sp.]
MSTDSADDRYTVPALMRGLQLLMQFSRDERELSGAELSRRLDLPRASVFRMLHTLQQCGFVERVGDGVTYRLGLAVLRLGFEYLSSMELTEHGRPVIEALRDACGYSAHLVVRDGREVVFIGKAPGRSALFHSIQVGARLPAHATVLGRLLLADLDLAALKALYPEKTLPVFTAKTPTTVAQLKALIEADRSAGFAISQGGFESGISTIAAPVFNERHEVAAAVSITVPSQRVDEAELGALVDQVRHAARQLTDRISHLPQRGDWQSKTLQQKNPQNKVA